MIKMYAFLFVALSLITQLSWAQKDVSLSITHLLDGSPFTLNTTAQNDLGHDFNLSRLEYYLSGFAITHDGGQVTPIDEFWALVNANQPTSIELGNFNIDQVEAISFYVGVDSAHNHLDPALYPMGHPLALKTPSMHWGWIGGYRFVALEGKSGPGLTQGLEIHGTGNDINGSGIDNYYQTQIVAPQLNTSANRIEIEIAAEYTGIVKNLDLSRDVFSHGSARESRTALLNFSMYVFSSAGGNTNAGDDWAGQYVQLFPNPSTDAVAHLQLEYPAHHSMKVWLADVLGRKIFQTNIAVGQQKIQIPTTQAGIYWVHVIQENATIACQKLVVK